MASPLRIAANRRNAARSTGPVTAAGKMRASRNALKHGLNISVRHDPETLNKIKALAVAIAGKSPTTRRLQAAHDVVEAQLEFRRLQEFRLSLIESEVIDIRAMTKEMGSRTARDDTDNIAEQEYAMACMRVLPVLSKLERYERRAHARHRRALRSYGIVTEE